MQRRDDESDHDHGHGVLEAQPAGDERDQRHGDAARPARSERAGSAFPGVSHRRHAYAGDAAAHGDSRVRGRPSDAGTGPRRSVASVLGGLAAPGRAQDRVDLVPIGPPDRHPVEPLDVLEVMPGDLAERPAAVAPEVEDAARRPAGRRAGSAQAVRAAHRRVEPAADGRPARGPVARHRLGRLGAPDPGTDEARRAGSGRATCGPSDGLRRGRSLPTQRRPLPGSVVGGPCRGRRRRAPRPR